VLSDATVLNEVVLALPREEESEAAGPSKRGAAIRDMKDRGCPPKMLGMFGMGTGVPGVPGFPGVDGLLDSMSSVDLFVCSPGERGRRSRTLDIVITLTELFQFLEVAARAPRTGVEEVSSSC